MKALLRILTMLLSLASLQGYAAHAIVTDATHISPLHGVVMGLAAVLTTVHLYLFMQKVKPAALEETVETIRRLTAQPVPIRVDDR